MTPVSRGGRKRLPFTLPSRSKMMVGGIVTLIAVAIFQFLNSWEYLERMYTLRELRTQSLKADASVQSYEYIGCATLATELDPEVTHQFENHWGMSVDHCIKNCLYSGYPVALVTQGTKCLCVRDNFDFSMVDGSACCTQCVMNERTLRLEGAYHSERFCGGVGAYSVYRQAKPFNNLGCHKISPEVIPDIKERIFFSKPNDIVAEYRTRSDIDGALDCIERAKHLPRNCTVVGYERGLGRTYCYCLEHLMRGVEVSNCYQSCGQHDTESCPYRAVECYLTGEPAGFKPRYSKRGNDDGRDSSDEPLLSNKELTAMFTAFNVSRKIVDEVVNQQVDEAWIMENEEKIEPTDDIAQVINAFHSVRRVANHISFSKKYPNMYDTKIMLLPFRLLLEDELECVNPAIVRSTPTLAPYETPVNAWMPQERIDDLLREGVSRPWEHTSPSNFNLKHSIQAGLFDTYRYTYKSMPFWHLSDVRTDGDPQIFVVTQLSIDRWDNLLRLQESWGHGMSVAIFIEADDDLEALERERRDPTNSELFAFCDMHLVFANGRIPRIDNFRFPINVLRNTALNNTRADYTFYVDVDFAVSPGAYDRIKAELNHESFTAAGKLIQDRSVLVAPAFDILVNQTVADKEEMLRLYRTKKAERSAPHWWPSQGPSNYTRWEDAKSPYTIQYKNWYEPYYVMQTAHMPRYNIDYRGWGIDKASQVKSLMRAGGRFVVSPSVFLYQVSHGNDTATDKWDIQHDWVYNMWVHASTQKDDIKFYMKNNRELWYILRADLQERQAQMRNMNLPLVCNVTTPADVVAPPPPENVEVYKSMEVILEEYMLFRMLALTGCTRTTPTVLIVDVSDFLETADVSWPRALLAATILGHTKEMAIVFDDANFRLNNTRFQPQLQLLSDIHSGYAMAKVEGRLEKMSLDTAVDMMHSVFGDCLAQASTIEICEILDNYTDFAKVLGAIEHWVKDTPLLKH